MRELVHFDSGRMTVSAAVGRVADALNPLGPVRDIVATIGACVVEIRQIDVERQRLDMQHQALSAYLVQRQREVAAVFMTQARIAKQAEVDREAIRDALRVVVRQSTDRYISQDERLILQVSSQ